MLEIMKLSAGYGSGPVIHGIDLEVRPGEIVALVGANGAGKSTLARTLSGLLPAVEGTIRFFGRDITRSTAAERVQAGLLHVPEGRQIFAGLTVEQNLELGAYGVARQQRAGEYEAMLQDVYRRFPLLRERAGSLAGNLSGGQQQTLAIARALMGRPRLLILDEPSLGLSPVLVTEIFNLAASLRGQGLSILLSEQNARMSLAIADRGYVIENGRVTLSAAASELLKSPQIAERYLGVDGSGTENRLSGAHTDRLAAAASRATRPIQAQ